MADNLPPFFVNASTPVDRPAFKFLHSRDLHFWTTEKCVKFDTLASYARESSVGGYSDPYETSIEGGTVKIRDVSDPASKRVIDNLGALGYDLKAGMELSFGRTISKRLNRFVYCVSDEINETIYRQWKKKEGYDAVIAIPSIGRWATAALKADQAGKGKFGRGCNILDVTYAKIPLDLTVVDLTQLVYFKDKREFEWQREFRVSWEKPAPIDEPPYFLTIPDLLETFTVLHVPPEWNKPAAA